MRNLIMFGALVAAGCTASAGPARVTDGEQPPMTEQVNIEFRVENAAGESQTRFAQGQPVAFVFVVRNAGGSVAQLGFTFPPHRVTVRSAAGGEPVWQAFEGRMFPQVMRYEDIAPGETKRFTVEWTAEAAPGEYVAAPEFAGFVAGEPLSSNLEPVTVTLTR